MRTKQLLAVLIILLSTTLTSCQAIGDVFKAGMWVGVIVVVAIIALVLWLIGKARR